MIAYLKGQVKSRESGAVVLDVGGVGYEIFVAPATAEQINVGNQAEFFIAENIKEDHYTLFGFLTTAERAIYYQLTSVSGVGPKAAISILAQHNPDEIETAIVKGSIELFSAVSGVGKKTAQRIILELKGKLVQPDEKAIPKNDPAHQALVSLGYQPAQAKEMLEHVATDLPLDARVKAALKMESTR